MLYRNSGYSWGGGKLGFSFVLWKQKSKVIVEVFMFWYLDECLVEIVNLEEIDSGMREVKLGNNKFKDVDQVVRIFGKVQKFKGYFLGMKMRVLQVRRDI